MEHEVTDLYAQKRNKGEDTHIAGSRTSKLVQLEPVADVDDGGNAEGNDGQRTDEDA